jgi:hypothetical protein
LQFDPENLTLGLKDLASQNGTYVNGHRIADIAGSLREERSAEAETLGSSSLLTVAGTTLRIDVMECPPKTAADLWKDGENSKKDCPLDCGS